MSKVLQRSLEAKLATLKGPEWDSSSDEEPETSKAKETKRLAKKRKTAATIGHESSKKTNNTSGATKPTTTTLHSVDEPSGVLYIGHLPDNFEEKEIKAFFSQFGTVLKVRLSRNKKFGRSRGYGFAEFIDPEVAVIVAETMNGYFLMDKRLVCHVVPLDKVHPQLFVGAGKKFKIINGSKLLGSHLEEKFSRAVGLKQISRNLVKRDKAKKAKLAKLGIDYEYPFIGTIDTPLNEKTLSEEKKVSTTSGKKKETKAVEIQKPNRKRKNSIGKRKKVEPTAVTKKPVATNDIEHVKKSTTKKKRQNKEGASTLSKTKSDAVDKESIPSINTKPTEATFQTPKQNKKSAQNSTSKSSKKNKQTEEKAAAVNVSTPVPASIIMEKTPKVKKASKKSATKSTAKKLKEISEETNDVQDIPKPKKSSKKRPKSCLKEKQPSNERKTTERESNEANDIEEKVLKSSKKAKIAKIKDSSTKSPKPEQKKIESAQTTVKNRKKSKKNRKSM